MADRDRDRGDEGASASGRSLDAVPNLGKTSKTRAETHKNNSTDTLQTPGEIKILKRLLDSATQRDKTVALPIDAAKGIYALWLKTLRGPQGARENNDPVLKALHEINQRLQKVEETTQRSIDPKEAPKTWASIAAAATTRPSIHSSTTMRQPPTTHNITIRPINDNTERTRDLPPKEALEIYREAFPKACAVSNLRSGDVRITLPDLAAKTAILRDANRIRETKGYKVKKEDYPVEVMAVQMSNLEIYTGKEAPARNAPAILALALENGRLNSGIKINRIQWVRQENHINGTARGRPTQEQKKTRGSIIVSLETENMRDNVLRNGFVVSGELHNATLYDYQLQLKRCFRCQKWGHTSTSCRANETCGHCLGDHQTRDCKTQEHSRCATCNGRNHKSWESAKCPRVKEMKERAYNLRVYLSARTDQIRTGSQEKIPQIATPSLGQKKRRIEESTGERLSEPPARRGVGRPPYSAVLRRAAISAGQQRIDLTTANLHTQNGNGGTKPTNAVQGDQLDVEMEVTNDTSDSNNPTPNE